MIALQMSSVPARAAWAAVAVGPSGSVAATMGTGNAPSGSVAGGTVTLTWDPSTLSTGGAATGYLVRRYDSTGSTEQTILTGTCAVAVMGTTCNETAVPAGTWRYSVTPRYQEWRGAESDKAALSVGVPSLALAPVLTTTPNTLAGSIGHFIAGGTIEFRLDSPSGTQLNGTVDGVATPALVPLSGSAAVTVGLPSGVAEGPHVIYAVATPTGQSAGASVTVDDTPPPAPSISSAPTSPSTSSTAAFEFASVEIGVAYECQIDGGSYGACTSPASFTGLGDGTHTFEVRAVDGAGNRSAASSHVWEIDTEAPNLSVTFPAEGSFLNNARYNQGCGTASTGDICGTAGDVTGVSLVEVSIRDGSGTYWDGTGFSSATEILHAATGTTNWSYTLAATSFPGDGLFTVRAVATDNVGHPNSTSTTFTIDRTSPFAADVQTANVAGGTTGRPQTGDIITFTYSEKMDPGSFLAGWDGSATNVVVRVNNGATLLLIPGPDTLQVWNASNSARLPFGEVDLGRSDYVLGHVTFGATGTPATMVQSDASITITLGTVSNGLLVTTALGSGTMQWVPSATARDLAGNSSLTSARLESGPADPDF